MKNELGIEVCCENCKQCTDNGNGCGLIEMPNDGIFGTRHCTFSPSKEAYETRISTLNKHYEEQIQKMKEQQFTKAELNTIIDALQMAKEEFAFCPEEKAFEGILKKIEQISKNSEANLKEQ